MRVHTIAVQEMFILQRKRGQVAGAHTDNRNRFGLGYRFAEGDFAVATPADAPQGLCWFECEWFERLRTVGPVKVAR